MDLARLQPGKTGGISDPDTDPKNERNNLIHDILFGIDDDEHKVEGFKSNHRTFKTYKKAYKTENKIKLHTNFYNICP